MAELVTIQNVLKRFSCTNPNDGNIAHAGTVYWITITMGLNSSSVFNSMSKTLIEGIFKQLSRDAVSDITKEQKPLDNVRVMKAINLIVLGVRYYSSRGVPLDNALMMKLNHAKAVQLFELYDIHRQKDVDKDETPELLVLKSNVEMNSTMFLEWLDQVSINLSSKTLVDGIGTLSANLCT